MQKISRQIMIDYARQEAARGSIYVWGAQGERGGEITEGWIRSRETSATNANRAIKTWNSRKAKYDPAMIGAYDCSGLIGACLNANGNSGFDDTADGYRNRCVRIDKSALQPGDFVFEFNGKRSGHVGIYIGNGRVVEARGRDHGVVETDLDARDWARYGRPDFMYADGEENPAPRPTPEPTPPPESGNPVLTRNLKLTDPMMRGDDVRMAQERLNYHKAGAGKADGVFGKNTKAAVIRFQQARIAEGDDLGSAGADGVIGPKTWKLFW